MSQRCRNGDAGSKYGAQVWPGSPRLCFQHHLPHVLAVQLDGCDKRDAAQLYAEARHAQPVIVRQVAVHRASLVELCQRAAILASDARLCRLSTKMKPSSIAPVHPKPKRTIWLRNVTGLCFFMGPGSHRSAAS